MDIKYERKFDLEPLSIKDVIDNDIYISFYVITSYSIHYTKLYEIEDFKTATISSFWNGKEDKVPTDIKVWCEVWLINNKDTHEVDVISRFENIAQTHGIEIQIESNIKFPERIITLAKLNAEDILNLINSYPYLAEIRPYSIV